MEILLYLQKFLPNHCEIDGWINVAADDDGYYWLHVQRSSKGLILVFR